MHIRRTYEKGACRSGDASLSSKQEETEVLGENLREAKALKAWTEPGLESGPHWYKAMKEPLR